MVLMNLFTWQQRMRQLHGIIDSMHMSLGKLQEIRKIPLEEGMATHSSIPGKSHRQRRLEGYSPWGHKESDTA